MQVQRNFWSENLKGRDHLEDTGVRTLEDITVNLKELCLIMDWNQLARGRV
jgi:hypothetical protein